MTLPPGFEVNVDVPWVDVNMTWNACPWHDATCTALHDQVVAITAAATAAWAKEFPDLAAALNPTVDDRVFDCLGPWAVPPCDTALDIWLLSATQTVDGSAGDLRVQAHAILRHRYANETQRRAVQPLTQPAFDAWRAWSDAHAASQFCNHAANRPGVLIEIAARGDHPRRTLLIGDTVPSGVSSGCCTEGVDDADVVLRYRDLREFIDAARVSP